YEEALRHDADCLPAAQALARILMNDPTRLVDRLGDALERATFVEQIVLIGNQIGNAVLQVHAANGQSPEPGVGVAPMKRVLAVAPDDIASLLQMSRLFSAQQVWAEARNTLRRIVEVARDNEARIAAYFMLAELQEGPLADLEAAQESLQSILGIDG